ncbi:MAG: tetratricopeptide repeat protein [Chloroflexi bacterium]|nr:tetratricopeptide repeat protein [Chloroflexota bacterium]
MKPMWTSYGGRARSGALPEAHDLATALARVERWTLPLGILLLFAYPNPLTPLGFALVAASIVLQIVRGGVFARLAPVDPWLLLLALGTGVGFVVAHEPGAAMLRLTGVVGALATFYAVRGYAQDQRHLGQAAAACGVAAAVGILAVLALLRGMLPDSPVTALLSPFLAPFSVFPGVTGDTLEVNARFTVHQYGLAHVLLLAASFAVAAAALGPDRRYVISGGLVLLGLLPLLLASQARGAFLALALAGTVVAAHRTRLAWIIPPAAVGFMYVLLQRGTISRGVESEWLNQRLGYWTGTVALLGDMPLTGAGLGMRTLAEVFAWYHQLPDPYQVSHTHNVVVQAYGEQGLLGAVGMAGLLIVGTVISLRGLRRARGPRRWLVGAAAGAFIGSAIYGMTDQVVSNNLSLALTLAMLAVTVSADRIWAPVRPPVPAATSARSRLGTMSAGRLAAAGALAIVALAGLAALAPRWISGIYLNAGSTQLLAAVLDRSRDADLRAARLARADDWLTQAVTWNSRNLPALRNLAWVKTLRHDLPAATSILETAYRPSLTPFERAQLARVSSEAGLVTLTVRLYREGEDEPRLKALAEKLWSGRRYHDAALAYAALIDLDPDQAEYISNFAKVVLDGGGDDGDALSALMTAVARKPESARNLSRQLVLTGEPFRRNEKRGGGNFKAAKFWFSLAAQVDPTYDRPRVELGSIHFYQGMYEEAAAYFQEARRLDPRNASTMHQIAESYLKLGRTSEAVQYYEQGVALAPRRAQLHLNLARAYVVAARREDAIRELHVALALPGNDDDQRQAQAEARTELQRIEAGG